MIDLRSARDYANTSTNILLGAKHHILALCDELEAQRAETAQLKAGLRNNLEARKDDLGQAASDWLTTFNPDGNDWFDARNVDDLVEAIIAGVSGNTPSLLTYSALIKDAQADALEHIAHMFRYQQYADFTERDKGFKEGGLSAAESLYTEVKRLRYEAQKIRGEQHD